MILSSSSYKVLVIQIKDYINIKNLNMNKRLQLTLALVVLLSLLTVSNARGKTYEDLADIIKNSNSHGEDRVFPQ